MKTYTPKKWELAGLQGISDATLETHFALYEGYVKNTNELIELTTTARQSGNASGEDPRFSEVVRRITLPPAKATAADLLAEVKAGTFGQGVNWTAVKRAVTGRRRSRELRSV